MGFNVVDHELLPFSCGKLAYVTPRFDVGPLGQHRSLEDRSLAGASSILKRINL